MVEAQHSTPGVAPPWEPNGFFTEEALRAAQEYWFQTHAKNSRMIAEGRSAVGFMKGHLRRKLEREMGEDFKMYTGQAIGAGGEHAESAGIRGELNQLLEQVHGKVAQGMPIQSPIQEDLTILTHPLGGLEVCYSMVFYYSSLMKQYATLAGNRRKVLKSILDEELFKWVWRMTIAFLMSPDSRKFDLQESLLSTGIRQIPIDRQRSTTAEKILEIGNFLIGKLLSESHLRFPIVFYFNTYCRYIQFSLLSRTSPQQCESVYNTIIERQKGDGVSDPIAAIDQLMNTTGNSGQSFDDVLKDEETEVEKYIPQGEIEFIGQYREFTRSNIGSSLKRIMPKGQATAAEGGATLMPLLLMLRTLPFYLRKTVLEKVPGPALNMFMNRLQHGADEVATSLANHVRETIDARSKSGETYTMFRQDQRVAVTTTVKPAAKPTPKAGAGAAAGPATVSSPARPAAPTTPRPAPAAPSRAPAAAAPSRTPAAAPRPAPAAARAAPSPSGAAEPLDQPVIVNWSIERGQLAVEAISARDLLRLAGPEARLIFQLVKFALQTGQVFRVPGDKVSKEMMESLIGNLIKQAPPGAAPVLSKEDRLALLEAGKGQSPKQLLAMLARKSARQGRHSAALQEILSSLSGKLGDELHAFLSNPSLDQFKGVVQILSAEERSTVGVLSRVARAA